MIIDSGNPKRSVEQHHREMERQREDSKRNKKPDSGHDSDVDGDSESNRSNSKFDTIFSQVSGSFCQNKFMSKMNDEKYRNDVFNRNPELSEVNMRKYGKQLDRVESKNADKNMKVKQFIINNPVSAAFLKREKGRLPYSVFKATANEVKFLNSKFKGRPPTVFFYYPAYVQHPQQFD